MSQNGNTELEKKIKYPSKLSRLTTLRGKIKILTLNDAMKFLSDVTVILTAISERLNRSCSLRGTFIRGRMFYYISWTLSVLSVAK